MYIVKEQLDNHFVLVIVCPEENVGAAIEAVRVEMKLDHYYPKQTHTIFVRVNANTIDNPALSEQ